MKTKLPKFLQLLSFTFLLGFTCMSTANAQEVSFDKAVSDFSKSADMAGPFSTTHDVQGNMFVVDYLRYVIVKITPDGNETIFAGVEYMPGNNDGPRLEAQFATPTDLAIDGAGNIYVADLFGHRIRKIGTDGQVTTMAGTGDAGFQNGPGNQAQFNYPQSICIDGDDNLYVADVMNHQIRKITPDGEVTTFAGDGTSGHVDGGLIFSKFNTPNWITIDGIGNLYVTEESNWVRKISTNGQVSTLAGTGLAGSLDGAALSTKFNSPQSPSVDEFGNVYVADRANHRIRKIGINGQVTTVAGSTSGYVNGKLSTAKFNAPYGVEVGPSGDIYVSDTSNGRVRRIGLPSLAFNSTYGALSDVQSFSISGASLTEDITVSAPSEYEVSLTSSGSFGTSVSVSAPGGVVNAATVYIRLSSAASIGDHNGDIILSSTGAVTKTLAIKGIMEKADQVIVFNGLTEKIVGDETFELTASTNSNLTISYSSSNTDVATIDGNVVTIVGAGKTTITASQGGNQFYNSADDVSQELTVSKAEIFFDKVVTTFASFAGGSLMITNPFGGAYDKTGNLYVADNGKYVILKITRDGTTTIFAGVDGSPGYNDGDKSEAQFAGPTDVAIDNSGNLYVADVFNHRIRKIGTNGQVTTLAGTGDAGFQDGPGNIAQFNYPFKLCIDQDDNLYVTDLGGNRIRKITSSGEVTTVAGTGLAGHTDGVATQSLIQSPNGITIDASGNLFISEEMGWIRKIATDGIISTLAGVGSNGFLDGLGSSAKFNSPQGIGVDGSGNIYVADRNNHRIRKIDGEGNVSTLAGSTIGIMDGGLASAKFNAPYGLTVNAAGDILLFDTNNAAIRKVSKPQINLATTFAVQSGESSLTISGKHLKGAATVSAPTGWKVSTTANTGFESSVSFSPTQTGDLNSKVIYLRLDVTANAANYNGNITIASEGAVSQTLPLSGTVGKASQLITFDELPSKVYGDQSFKLTASASSNQPVSYTSSDLSVATIDGDMLKIVGAGKASITAMQTGENYEDASKSQEVNIAKSVLTVKADNSNRKYGKANPIFIINYIGFKNGENEDVIDISPTVTTDAKVTSDAGDYSIEAIGGDDNNYSFEYVKGILTIVKADQTITFASINDKVMGSSSFEVSASSSSGLPVTFTTLSDELSINGTQVTLAKAGKSAITALQAGDKNYNAAIPIERSFCVNPAKPTISASFANSSAPVLTSSAFSGNRWFLNDASISASDVTYTVSVVGSYQVQSVADECASELSDKYAVVVTGDLAKSENRIQVNPNPSVDFVTITGVDAATSFKLVSVSGADQLVEASQENEGIKLDVRNLASGLYIIRTSGKSGNHQLKFVKK